MDKYKIGGMIPSPADPRDYRVSRAAKAKIPESWTPPRKIKIHDQGKVNSCVGHALAMGYEQNGSAPMSFGWIYGNRRHTEHMEEGLIPRDALKTLQKDGVPTFAKHPYDAEVPEIIQLFEQHFEGCKDEAGKYKIGSYYRLYTAEECRQAMYAGKKVVLGIILTDTVKEITPEDPVLKVPSPEGGWGIIGGHLVAAHGWDERGVRFANSWGESWGENGFGYVPDEMFSWSEMENFPIPLIEAWAFEVGATPEPPRKSGWYKQENKWRYRKEDGSDAKGWLKLGNEWYFLQPDGYMKVGWVKDGHWWYYLGTNGAMRTGYVCINGETFRLNEVKKDIGKLHIPCGACLITDERGNIV